MIAAHYIIFHPERKRTKAQVKAVALTPTGTNRAWVGDVWVDKPNGNEDPFVFVEPWVYSYCHATQLRREPRHSSYVKPGSYLIYCSGEEADEHRLCVDTVLLVGEVAKWQWGKKIDLPSEFMHHKHDAASDLWMRHLRFGMGKQHKGRYTYQSCMWHDGAVQFSFLPLSASGERPAFPINQLPSSISTLVSQGVKGKRPVLLNDKQLHVVLHKVEQRTTIKVVKGIIVNSKPETSIDTATQSC